MKMWEIAELSRDDIEQRLADSLEEYQNLRFQHSIRQLDNALRLRFIRRDIARLKTVLHKMDMELRSNETEK